LCVRIRDVIASFAFDRTDVLGPHAAPLSRLRGRYRYDLVLRAPDASTLRRLLSALEQSKTLKIKSAALIVDVDPVSFA
jgi:primosomal protein N' (replication factor Y)